MTLVQKEAVPTRIIAAFITCISAFVLFTAVSYCIAEEDPTSKLEGNYTESQVDEIMAGLDDAQVRQLLIEELKKDAAREDTARNQEAARGGMSTKLAAMLTNLGNDTDSSPSQMDNFVAAAKTFFPSIGTAYGKIRPEGSTLPTIIYFFTIIGIIGLCLLLGKWSSIKIATTHFTIDSSDLPTMGGPAKLISGVARMIPDIIGLFIFIFLAYLLFLLLLPAEHIPIKQLFVATLSVVATIKVIAIIAEILYSPKMDAFRFLPMKSTTADVCARATRYFFSYVLVAYYVIILTRIFGGGKDALLIISFSAATLFTIIMIMLILRYKNHVTALISDDDEDEQTRSWAKKAFASVWHLPALVYVVILWLLLINNLFDTTAAGSAQKGAFILSFLIVPAWLVVNSIGQWITRNVMASLHIYQHDQVDEETELSEEEQEAREAGRRAYIKASNVTRIIVSLGVMFWVADLWNFHIPYLSQMTAAFIDILIIMAAALLFWQFIDRWIENKLASSLPEPTDEEADQDEWGGAANLDRSHTLLPMVRKFVGSTLVVMVVLTILSAMGINIGPLLAGAGVVGLAVGFGAQKLVSDVFSGFFYLLDDAFRVGEYIEAGGISGAVEAITLRNVMIRHHLGMLQIVPFSDLGAVTNFMRGGVVVKFTLDFPYNADVEKIRKVIKKVGQAMLKNEEYGDDFISPVKSAGVREITNSVMTIRVKFTAQPGTHFVIRREAYRLITEALAAKGIHYAHRKVIVDIPKEITQNENLTDEQKQQVVNAAGAAALEAVQQEDQAAKKSSGD
ncbi:MAG: hypothetical protein D6B25_08660 [Desulfobulbaceae bacterium]|nr:MAG: hypothetical protein D6B25_08660 [Desulfobulbaceae bacterium]